MFFILLSVVAIVVAGSSVLCRVQKTDNVVVAIKDTCRDLGVTR